MYFCVVDGTQLHFLNLDELNNHLNSFSGREIFILADENTYSNCLPLLSALNNTLSLVLEAGERTKSLNSCEKIWDFLQKNGANRNSLLINLGGGVITDLGGFAASLYQRGIDFIHIPTSLLAMVDASIGGKTGIDFQHLKNYIGNFTPAIEILICPDFLGTLPKEEWFNGWSESIKHALIADEALLTTINQQINKNPFQISLALLQRICKIKSDIVDHDPKEQHIRKALNFGHTIGHALESFFLIKGQPIPHGLAVAAGMIIESSISQQVNSAFVDLPIVLNTLNYFPRIDFKFEDCAAIAKLTLKDKKNANGIINLTTLKRIGQYKIDSEIALPIVHQALENYCKYEQ